MKLISKTAFILTLFALTFRCSSGNEASKATEEPGKLNQVSEKKITPEILAVVKKLQAEKVSTVEAMAVSNSQVKVDEHGNVHCYIYLTETNEENLSKIRPKLSKLDLVNRELNVVQAWVPFPEIQQIAQLEFVQRISQPDYAIKLK